MPASQPAAPPEAVGHAVGERCQWGSRNYRADRRSGHHGPPLGKLSWVCLACAGLRPGSAARVDTGSYFLVDPRQE
jgi:hypothetical protein